MAEMDSGSSGGDPDADGPLDYVFNLLPGANSGSDQSGPSIELSALTDEQNSILGSFLRSPVGFVLGIILQEILGGLEAITTLLIDSFRVLLVGSGPGTTGDVLGLADIPTYLGEIAVSIIQPTPGGRGGTIGDALIALARIPVTLIVDLAGQAGPLEPIILAGGSAAVMIGGAWVLRQLLVIAADAVPGAEVLLP